MFRRDPFAETNSRLEREMAILASERAMERKSSMGKAPATVVEINPAAPPPSTDIVPEKWAMETEVEPIDERHGNLKNAKSTTSAQRKLIAFAVLAILVFVLNAVPVIGFGIGSFGFKDESHQSYGSLSGVIYEGTCTQTKTFDFWIHLLINVLSTALLMGNSKAMQTLRLLVANGAGESRLSSHPQVHSTSRPRGALALWIILGLSSVPIHLLYNSSIYETIGATGFSWAIVGQDFLESGPASIGPNGLDNSFGPIYADMRANGSTWERLNNSECIQTYGADYLTDRGNVLLITSNNDSASSMYQYGSAGAAQYGTSFGWMCEQEYQYTSVPTAKCNLSELEASAANWTLGIKDPGPSYPIKYCLSESITSHCWVQLKWSFLLSVAAFNLLKVICLILCVVITRKSRCMLTVGDMQVHKPRWWIQAPSPFVVVAAVLLSIGGIAAAAVGLNKAFMNEQGFGKSIDFKSLWKQGFGTISSTSEIQQGTLIPQFGYAAIPATVLLVNAPQVIITFCFFLYTSMFTTMVSYSLYNRPASPKVLAQPALKLPLLYTILISAFSTVIHWMCSQSFFLASVNTGSEYYVNAGFSPVAIIFTVGVGAVAFVVLLGMGLRRYKD